MRRYRLGTAVCVMAVAGLVPARAADLGGLKINGFGQVVVGSTLNNNKPYPTSSQLFPGGTAGEYYSYDADPKFDQESLFALQVTAPLTGKMTATAQIVAHGSNNFSTQFEWAYINYQFNSNWSLKVGRQRDPIFFYSDYLEVGVAYPWIRVPSSVYGAVGTFSNIDGISVNYSANAGDWEFDQQFVYGRFNAPLAAEGLTANLDSKNGYGLSVRAGYGDWMSLRVALFQSAITIQVPGVNEASSSTSGTPTCSITSLEAQTLDLVQSLQCIPTISGFTPQETAGFDQAASQLNVFNDPTTYFEAGVNIDNGHWVLIGEYVQDRVSRSYTQRQHDSYIGAGHHFGRWLPMFTYGRQNDSPQYDILGEMAPGLKVLGSNASTLVAGIEQLTNTAYGRNNYYQWDLRYDLANNVALKFDYTRFRTHIPTFNESQLVSAGLAFSF